MWQSCLGSSLSGCAVSTAGGQLSATVLDSEQWLKAVPATERVRPGKAGRSSPGPLKYVSVSVMANSVSTAKGSWTME